MTYYVFWRNLIRFSLVIHSMAMCVTKTKCRAFSQLTVVVVIPVFRVRLPTVTRCDYSITNMFVDLNESGRCG